MLFSSRNIVITGVLLLMLMLFFGLFWWSDSSNSTLSGVVDYNVHVRPILSDKCFKCHGPDATKREANLRLDLPESAFAELKDAPGKFAIVAGNVEKSELLRRIKSHDTEVLMPPPASNLALTPLEIATLETWIAQGAVYQTHWAFSALVQPSLPASTDKAWEKNEIDLFVGKKLQEVGISHNKQADPERLLKRLCADITGLPPTVEMQADFLANPTDAVYEKWIDTLLADKHYGEKMAINWMDVARYADSHGYQDDGYRTMWPWRDWVIHAFNANYSYQKFVTWQLSGDLLPDKNKESILATGFNRNHKITQEGGVIDEEYRVEYVSDRTNTFGKAFLALTFECAKCHDHKYDPILQKDYYSCASFFDQVPERGFFGDIQTASLADPPIITITDKDIAGILQFVNKQDTAPVMVMVMQDSIKRRPTFVLSRGQYDQRLDAVVGSMPKAIMAFDTTTFSQNRLGLSGWLFDNKNPLTARVFVNRVWADIFGTGIVKTAGDFGMQGELPSHPELLDWLAADFRDHDWNIKRLVKQIVLSATYRQSAVIKPENLVKDNENRYLSSFPRKRLRAELLRDFVLATSGLLNPDIGGPSVKPYQPDGIWEATTSGRGELAVYNQDKGDKLYRRGLYSFIKRTAPPPVMLSFDASTRDQCEVRRMNTSTPIQALMMLNDPFVLEAARVLSERLSVEKTTAKQKIEAAFRRILCRKITDKELTLFAQYYEEEKARFSKNTKRAAAFLQVGEYEHIANIDVVAAAALMQMIDTMYNMEEASSKG